VLTPGGSGCTTRQGQLPGLAATTAAEDPRWDAVAEAAFDTLTAQAAVANNGMFGRKKRRTVLAQALQPFLASVVDQATVLDTVAAAVAAQDTAS